LFKKEFTAKEKLEIVQPVCRQAGPKESLLRAGGRGGLGGIPPTLQILGEISSNFFERTPPKINIFRLIEVRVKFFRMVRKFNRKKITEKYF